MCAGDSGKRLKRILAPDVGLSNSSSLDREFGGKKSTDAGNSRGPQVREPNYFPQNPSNPIDRLPAARALTASKAVNKELEKDKRKGINRLKIPANPAKSPPKEKFRGQANLSTLNAGTLSSLTI